MKKSLFTTVLFFAFIITFGQWVEIEIPQNSFPAKIEFLNTDTALLFGGNDISRPHYFRTENAGATWDSVNLDFSSWLTSAYFLDENTGFIGGGAVFSFPPTYLSDLILKTTDGGLTFDSIHGDFSSGSILDIAFADENNGLFVGDFYSFKTNDGGNTIDTLNFSNNPQNQFFHSRSVEYPDINNAYAAINGSLVVKSTNQGESWDTILNGNSQSLRITEMQFINANNGFIITRDGEFITTTNGGNSFNTTTVDTSLWFTDVHFENNNIGFIAAHNQTTSQGYLYKTNNGGNSWILEEIDTNFTVGRIEFVNNNIYTYSSNKLFVSSLDSFISVGVKDITEIELKLFPNPSNDIINIQIPKMENTLFFEIVDNTGNSILKQKIESTIETITIENLPTGSYCLVVKDSFKPISFQRFIKK